MRRFVVALSVSVLVAGAAGCKKRSSRSAAPPPGPPAPSILSVTPSSGPVTGGTTVTIGGSDFQAGATVRFGTLLAAVSTNAPTSIVVTAPAGVAIGAVDVTVTNPDLQSATSVGGFTYTTVMTATPVVTGVTPGSGTTNGGTPVTIAGTGFLLGATVTFGGGTATSVVVVSATTITAVTPSGSAGPVTVTVTNPGPSSGNLASAYTYTAAGTTPSISGVTPSSGPAAGGTAITIGGSSFVSTPTVTVAGAAATNVSLGGSLTATTPLAPRWGPPGAQTVTVTNPGGDSASSAAFTYLPNFAEAANAPASDPDIAIDTAGTHHVVYSATAGGGTGTDIYYVRSTDNGLTWSTPAPLSSTSAFSGVPAIAASGNTLAVVWLEPGTSSTVEYRTSTDNGANWSTAATVPAPASPTGTALGSPDVAIDANARLYVAYTLNTGQLGPPTFSPTAAIVRVSGTLTGLSTATATTAVTGVALASLGTAIAADGNGNAIHVWTSSAVSGLPAGGASDMSAARTTDGGSSWTGATSLFGLSQPRISSPTVALRGADAVAGCYHDSTGLAPGGAIQIQTRGSGDTGQSWNAAVPVVSGTAVLGGPAVAVDVGGFFTLSWDEYNGTTSAQDVRVSRSSNVGAVWATPSFLAPSSNASTATAVAAGAPGAVFYVWAEFNGSIPGNDIRHW